MTMFQKLIDWWRRPPAAQRILDALSTTEWRRPLDIANAARVSVGGFYDYVLKMENDGIVESKWDDGPIPAARQGRRRRLYRRIAR